ncbi:MAG: helix-turn-helix domain-containing protein [Acidimicrobiales bacterium]
MDEATPAAGERIQWMSTKDASERLGVTLRTLYRFIDEGQVPAYQFGRVIRLKATDVAGFIETSRITPGTLKHLYPEPKSDVEAKRDVRPTSDVS